MADMLRDGLVWLTQQREAHMSAAVDYWVGTDTVIRGVPATVGRTETELETSDGVRVQGRTQDFIIRACNLSSEPKRGDRIEWCGDIYEVMPLFGSESWAYTDGHRRSYRIHTKYVGEA